MKYVEALPHQIDQIVEECPLAIIPWGAHEWHGPQNAIGLDALKANYMALDLSDEVGGVVLPPVFCGYQTMKPHAGFRHCLEFPRELVTWFAREHLEQLYDEGFRVLLILMGHYGGAHVEAIQEAVERFRERHTRARAVAWQDYLPATWVDISGGDHAGKNETSLLMHYRPDLVDVSQLPDDEEITTEKYGIGGEDPRQASEEHGRMLVEIFIEQAAPKLREMIDEVLAIRERTKDHV